MNSSPEDRELYQKITDICFNNGGVTKSMADKLMIIITTSTAEAYKKGYITGGIDQLTNPTEAHPFTEDPARSSFKREFVSKAELKANPIYKETK